MNIQLDEYRLKLNGLGEELHELGEGIGISGLQEEIKVLETETEQPEFFSDTAKMQQVMQKVKQMKDKVARFENLRRRWEDACVLVSLAIEEDDDSLLEEVVKEYDAIIKSLGEQRLETLLSGEYDSSNAILTFHSGAGGTEAQDWALMLYRMYTRWGEKKGFKVKVLDILDGEEAGIKSASIMVEGYNAYGYLKGESGVHRLVRISPFDGSGRRHTSFASLEVVPEIDDKIKIEIRDEDLRVDTYRSSGAGGQHVNKTESAIRITHIPSGIVVACQNERSQFQNRDVAMTMLRAKLFDIKQRENLERIEDIKGEQMAIGWGSQIRSYVFMPYTLVKDHRTDFEVGNINAVMDGELDGFINAYLKGKNLGTLKN